NIEALVELGLTKIIEIENALREDNITGVRKEIGSIYPEKVVFDGTKVRTARRNEFVDSINLINNKLRINKKGTKLDFSTLSRQVGKTGFEPAAPWSQTRCATGLRHFPVNYAKASLTKLNYAKASLTKLNYAKASLVIKKN